jgi:hypothetical protein
MGTEKTFRVLGKQYTITTINHLISDKIHITIWEHANENLYGGIRHCIEISSGDNKKEALEIAADRLRALAILIEDWKGGDE